MFRPIPILQNSPSDADIKRFSINPAIWNMGLGRFGSLVGSISFQPTWCSFPKKGHATWMVIACHCYIHFKTFLPKLLELIQHCHLSHFFVVETLSSSLFRYILSLSQSKIPNKRHPVDGDIHTISYLWFYDILWFTNSLRPWKKQTYPAICLSKAHGVDKHILWAQQIRRSMAQPSDGHTFVPGCFPKRNHETKGGCASRTLFLVHHKLCLENFVSQYQVQWMDSNMVSFPNNEMISRSKIWNIRMYS